MMPYIEIYEKLLLEHRQHLQREAERRHLLAQTGLGRQGSMSYLLRRIGKLFVARRSSMKPVEQMTEVFADYAEEPARESELQEVRG